MQIPEQCIHSKIVDVFARLATPPGTSNGWLVNMSVQRHRFVGCGKISHDEEVV